MLLYSPAVSAVLGLAQNWPGGIVSFLTFTPQLGGLEGLSEMKEAPCLSKLSSFLHGALSRLRRFFCTWLQANVWKSVTFSV